MARKQNKAYYTTKTRKNNKKTASGKNLRDQIKYYMTRGVNIREVTWERRGLG